MNDYNRAIDNVLDVLNALVGSIIQGSDISMMDAVEEIEKLRISIGAQEMEADECEQELREVVEDLPQPLCDSWIWDVTRKRFGAHNIEKAAPLMLVIHKLLFRLKRLEKILIAKCKNECQLRRVLDETEEYLRHLGLCTVMRDGELVLHRMQACETCRRVHTHRDLV